MTLYSGHYIAGDRKVDCDICGYTYRFTSMRIGVSGKQIGLEVCPDCFDPEHPRDKPVVLRPAQPLAKVK